MLKDRGRTVITHNFKTALHTYVLFLSSLLDKYSVSTATITMDYSVTKWNDIGEMEIM